MARGAPLRLRPDCPPSGPNAPVPQPTKLHDRHGPCGAASGRYDHSMALFSDLEICPLSSFRIFNSDGIHDVVAGHAGSMTRIGLGAVRPLAQNFLRNHE